LRTGLSRWIAAYLLLALPGLACQSSAFESTSPGSVLFQDDFSDSSSGWLSGEDSFGIAGYSNGGLRIYVASDLSGKISILRLQPFTDTYIEVDATKLAGPDDNDYGIVCRYVDENNFYFFEISSDGYCGIGKYRDNQLVMISAAQMQASEAIVQGAATNRLRAGCVGTQLTLYVNETKVAEGSDADFSSGNVGLIAGTFETPGVDIVFDNFSVLQP
jgi:hypothetical protein